MAGITFSELEKRRETKKVYDEAVSAYKSERRKEVFGKVVKSSESTGGIVNSGLSKLAGFAPITKSDRPRGGRSIVRNVSSAMSKPDGPFRKSSYSNPFMKEE